MDNRKIKLINEIGEKSKELLSLMDELKFLNGDKFPKKETINSK